MGGGHAVADALSEVERRAMMKILIVMIIHIGLFFRSSSAPNDMTFSNSLYDNGLRNGVLLSHEKGAFVTSNSAFRVSKSMVLQSKSGTFTFDEHENKSEFSINL